LRVQIAGPAESTGPTGTLSLASIAEFQAYIEKPGDAGGPFDTLCQLVLDSACVGAFSLMGGRFLKRPAAEFEFAMTPEAEDRIFLHQWPVGTVSALEAGGFTANGVWQASYVYTAQEWYADMRSGRLYGTWPWGIFPPSLHHAVRVRWTGGFTTVPADAKEAVMQWAGVKLNRTRKARWDVTSSQGPTEGYTFSGELPDFAAATFAKYTTPEASIA